MLQGTCLQVLKNLSHSQQVLLCGPGDGLSYCAAGGEGPAAAADSLELGQASSFGF